jgi:hypothetical protein
VKQRRRTDGQWLETLYCDEKSLLDHPVSDIESYRIPIPPAKKFVDSGFQNVVILSVVKEVDNEVIESRVMEACMLLLPVPCTVQ